MSWCIVKFDSKAFYYFVQNNFVCSNFFAQAHYIAQAISINRQHKVYILETFFLQI